MLNKLFKQQVLGKDEHITIGQHTLRRLIGVLGMVLPILLFLFLWLECGWTEPLESISHYYFTRAAAAFIIIVSLLAIFLLLYKGKDPIDFWLSTLAGIAALCVLLFPTDNISEQLPDELNPFSVTLLRVTDFTEPRVAFHYISAAVFLLCLACMSLFLFTKSDKSLQARGRQKRRRNRIYIVCGVVMLIAILVVFVGGFLEVLDHDVYKSYHITFWMEAIAVESFGISWLIKGEAILKDVSSPTVAATETDLAGISEL